MNGTATVVSQDGTTITYDHYGSGPAVILVGGAFQHRAIDPSTADLAARLATARTVLHYDRRGRGDSGDTPPCHPDREVEDIAALVEAVGGSAALYGMSSGAVLALDAASAGLPVTALVLYEAPLVVDDSGQPRPDLRDRVRALLADGDRAGAVRAFVTAVGATDEMVDQMLAGPAGPLFTAVAPTLAYDLELMADLSRGEPIPDTRRSRWATVEAPALVLDGGASPPAMASAADAVATALPHARRHTLPGQTHEVATDALAPVVAEFLAAH